MHQSTTKKKKNLVMRKRELTGRCSTGTVRGSGRIHPRDQRSGLSWNLWGVVGELASHLYPCKLADGKGNGDGEKNKNSGCVWKPKDYEERFDL